MRFLSILCGMLLISGAAAAQAGFIALSAPPKPAAAPVVREAAVRPTTLTGYVLDADGLPLAGVTAQVVGSTQIAITNAEGVFMVRVPAGAKGLELQCSYAGLDDQRVRVKSLEEPLYVEMGPSRAASPKGRK